MQILIWVMIIAFLVMMAMTQEMINQIERKGKSRRLFQIFYYVAGLIFLSCLLVITQIFAVVASKAGVVP